MIYKYKGREKEYWKQWKKENLEKVREYHKKWKKENLEKARECSRKWNQKHLEYGREYVKNRRKTDIQFRLNGNMSRDICMALKGKKAGRKWESLVSYTIQDLIQHLEKQFDENMSWQNYGKYWHIDHRKPKSLFNYDKSEDLEFQKCWGLGNLQPMEKIENIRKSNYYEEE